MISLYTPEIEQIVRSAPWPKGLIVVPFEQKLPHTLMLIFYRDNFEELSPSQQLVAAEVAAAVIQKIRATGCPCYFEVDEYAPR